MKLTRLVIAGFVWLILTPAFGQTEADKLKAMTERAEAGDVEDQCNLGSMYFNGFRDIVPQDHTKGIYWLTKAAKQGHARANSELGDAYCKGEGVPQDYKKALTLFTAAAKQGYCSAQLQLGSMNMQGQGGPVNFVKALEWYTKAADQGDIAGQAMLSIFYSEGVGVPTNYKKALEFGTKAAERGFPAAQATLGSCYRNGWGVPQDFKTAYAWFSLASAADTIFATSRDEAAKHLTPQALLEAQALASKLYSEILTNKVGGL